MDIEEIRNMTDEQLTSKLTEFENEKSELRVQQAIAPPENPMRLKHLRKSIARIKTVLRERELEEETINE